MPFPTLPDDTTDPNWADTQPDADHAPIHDEIHGRLEGNLTIPAALTYASDNSPFGTRDIVDRGYVDGAIGGAASLPAIRDTGSVPAGHDDGNYRSRHRGVLYFSDFLANTDYEGWYPKTAGTDLGNGLQYPSGVQGNAPADISDALQDFLFFAKDSDEQGAGVAVNRPTRCIYDIRYGRISYTIERPWGVELWGVNSDTNLQRWPAIAWDGPAGGVMFRDEAKDSDFSFQRPFRYLHFQGSVGSDSGHYPTEDSATPVPGHGHAATAWDYPAVANELDSLWMLEDLWFSGFDGDAITLRSNMRAAWFHRIRWDGANGYAINAVDCNFAWMKISDFQMEHKGSTFREYIQATTGATGAFTVGERITWPGGQGQVISWSSPTLTYVREGTTHANATSPGDLITGTTSLTTATASGAYTSLSDPGVCDGLLRFKHGSDSLPFHIVIKDGDIEMGPYISGHTRTSQTQRIARIETDATNSEKDLQGMVTVRNVTIHGGGTSGDGTLCDRVGIELVDVPAAGSTPTGNDVDKVEIELKMINTNSGNAVDWVTGSSHSVPTSDWITEWYLHPSDDSLMGSSRGAVMGQDSNGTLYKLVPPAIGGGAATWTAV